MQLSGYRKTVSWMVRDTLLRYRWQNALGTALHFSGLFLQVTAITLAIYYAKQLESNNTLTFFGNSFIPRESLLLLFSVGLGVGLLQLISSVFIWSSQKLMLLLRRRYYEFCTTRIFQLLEERGAPTQTQDKNLQVQGLFLLARREAIYNSRYYGSLLGAIVPGCTALAAFITLLVTDVTLTAGLLVLLALAFPFILRGNKRSSLLSNEVDQRANDCALELKAAINQQLDGENMSQTPLPKSANWIDAYMGRLGAAIHSDLITNLLVSASVVSLIIGVGYQALQTGSGWGRIAVYLIALRYFLSYLQGFIRCITTMNQFHSQATRYKRFVEDGIIPIESTSAGEEQDGIHDV